MHALIMAGGAGQTILASEPNKESQTIFESFR